MKNIISRIFRGVLSVITTFVLMAAPVAAIIYSSDSTVKQFESAPLANYTSERVRAIDKKDQVIEKNSVEYTVAVSRGHLRD